MILSLCDFSGQWPEPYACAGVNVVCVDPKFSGGAAGSFVPLSMTVQRLLTYLQVDPQLFDTPVFGVLAAPPCTDFASSGARWWNSKGHPAEAIEIVDTIMDIIEILKPSFWALENPVGRIQELCPRIGEPKMSFDPCDYAGWADRPHLEAVTKHTILWGEFNTNLEKRPLEPVFRTSGGKKFSPIYAALGGKSARTKEIRSRTPQGFSRAFFLANQPPETH